MIGDGMRVGREGVGMVHQWARMDWVRWWAW